MNLVHDHRPRQFEDVRGQPQAIATITAQLRQDVQRPLLFTGPPGVGKTATSHILAAALNCTAPESSGSPCLACDQCVCFEKKCSWFFAEVNAGELNGKDVALYLAELGRSRPMFGSRGVIVINDADGLTRPAENALLGVLELPGAAAFILSTNFPERLLPALRSRCTQVRFFPLPKAELVGLGRDVCTAENIVAEPDALALIAAAAHGQARDFLAILDAIAASGAVTVAAAVATLDLTWADLGLETLAELVRSGRTPKAWSDWDALAPAKATALRDGLAFVAIQRFDAPMQPEAVHEAFLVASASAVDDVAAAVVQRATALGLSPIRCALDWANFWSTNAPNVYDHTSLALRLLEFAHLVCAPSVPLPVLPPPQRPAPSRPVRRRSGIAAAKRRSARGGVNTRGVWATKREAVGIYRAATLLPQSRGLWFNTRLRLHYAAHDVTDVAAGLQIFSNLTHELGLCLRRWVGERAFCLHWLAQHEGDGAGSLVTHLLMHVPQSLQEPARAWLSEFLPVPPWALVQSLDSEAWRVTSASRPHVGHWSLVRELWRIVDPAVVDVDEQGRRRPLRELLGVPPQGPRWPDALPGRVRRFSSSHSLSSNVWRAATEKRFAYVSALDRRAWGALDRGWEAQECLNRREEARRRDEALAVLRQQFPPGVSAAQDAVREERRRTLLETWPLDPWQRPRQQPPW